MLGVRVGCSDGKLPEEIRSTSPGRVPVGLHGSVAVLIQPTALPGSPASAIHSLLMGQRITPKYRRDTNGPPWPFGYL